MILKNISSKVLAIFVISGITVISVLAVVTHTLFSDSVNVNANKNKEQEIIREANKLERDSLIKDIEDVYNYYLSRYYPIEDVSKLTNQQILKFGEDLSGISSNAESFDNAIKKYLYNVEYHHEDLQCFCGNTIYLYDKTLNSYVYNENHFGHGGGMSLYMRTKVFYEESNIVNEKEIEFKVRILYERFCGDTCMPYINSYYRSITDSINRDSPLIGDPNLEEDYIVTDEDYERIKDSIPVTTFKIVIENDNYLLKGVTIE